MILVTHDISVVAYVCDRVVVMYAGKVVEDGSTAEVLERAAPPLHDGPHQRLPGPRAGRRRPRADRGQPARPARPAEGLPLRAALPVRPAGVHARSSRFSRRKATTAPPATAAGEARDLRASAPKETDARGSLLVEARDLAKHYPAPRSVAEVARRQAARCVRAVDGVEPLARAGRERRPPRRIRLRQDDDRPPAAEARRAERRRDPLRRASRSPGSSGARTCAPFRKRAQLVFQNPFDAINPRFTIERALAEPLVNTGVPATSITTRIETALRRVRLPPLARFRGLLPAPALGRAAAAHRARARARARACVPGRRRARLDARRQRPRRRPQRHARRARAAGLDRAVHLPRPRAGALRLLAHARDVSRPHRRGRTDRGAAEGAAAPLHPRARQGRAGAAGRSVAASRCRSAATCRTLASRRPAAASATAAPSRRRSAPSRIPPCARSHPARSAAACHFA